MTYSCTDFADTILEALEVNVPDESNDSPGDQADLALDAIRALKSRAASSALSATERELVVEALAMAASRHEAQARSQVGRPRGRASHHDRKAEAMRDLRRRLTTKTLAETLGARS